MTTADRAHDPLEDPTQRKGLDPGAFVGNRRERQAETIPGGVRPDDRRIAAHGTQVGDDRVDAPVDRREAGQDR